MRTETINGIDYDVRPLKRGEIKELRKKGFNLLNLNNANAEEATDAVFELVFTPEQNAEINEMDNPDALKLWKAVFAETYLDDAEKKT